MFKLNRGRLFTGNLCGLIYVSNLFWEMASIWCWKCLLCKDADLARKAIKPIERVLSSTSEEDEPGVVKFLKMNCRYFTDGKVCGSVICFLFLESVGNEASF